MDANQISQIITQLGLSAVFLFMLYKLWQRHMAMTDKIIAILLDDIAYLRAQESGEQTES